MASFRLPIARVDRYTGSDTEYQLLADWIVGQVWANLFDVKKGVLGRIILRFSASSEYDHGFFRVTVEKPYKEKVATFFEDKKVLTATLLVFPPNELDVSNRVKVEVKTDGTSVTAEGIITGIEVT